jgi:hypothetical protein
MAKHRTVNLRAPDAFGAVRYDITFADRQGNLVDERSAATYAAEGYDEAGQRVGGIWGQTPAPTEEELNAQG